MLLELNIKNFAIINNLKVSFTEGFNVLTGETGAGKSIIIDALGLILGKRSNKDFIKSGENKSIIEALFYLEKPKKTKKILNDYGISFENDNMLLITREIHKNGRSLSRINGHTITLSMLKNITYYLVDIYGQNEHQTLLNTDKHLELIDSLGNNELLSSKKEVYMSYIKLLELNKQITSIVTDEIQREREIDLLKFQLDEINSARLNENEEEELMTKYGKISNVEEISNTLNSVYNLLDSDDYNNSSIISNLSNVSNRIGSVSKFDNNIFKYEKSINEIIYQIQDLSRDIRYYFENIDYDIKELKFLEDRIELINRLKRKYGSTIKDILNYRNKIEKELNEMLNNEKLIDRLQNEIRDINEKVLEYSKILSEERKKIIKKFEKDIINELNQLNMKNVNFKVNHEILNKANINGIDKLEFLISTNIGEPLKKLSKVASGGEMSRIMLAFKSIISDVDNISTMIFDEIDTGISGRTAQIVGEKMLNISKKHQILSVTHLPQIAAIADSHYLISKKEGEKDTETNIELLNQKERIEELSRLLGGVNLTETTRLHAQEMIKMSKNI